MSKQKTAIEFLIHSIHEDMFQLSKSEAEWKEIFEKAKELEKQQHSETWDEAIKAHDNRGHVSSRSICDFDDYFDENFINETNEK